MGALNGLFNNKLKKIRRRATNDARAAGHDLRKATSKLYTKLAGIQLTAAKNNAKTARAINSYAKKTRAAVARAKLSFRARLSSLTNVVARNNRKSERGLEVLTGVIRNYKTAGKKDLRLIRAQSSSLNKDMQAKIVRFTQ